MRAAWREDLPRLSWCCGAAFAWAEGWCLPVSSVAGSGGTLGSEVVLEGGLIVGCWIAGLQQEEPVSVLIGPTGILD